MVLGAAWREKAGKNKAAARSRMKNRRPTFALPAQGNLTARADIPSQCNPSETPRATFQIGLKTEQPLFLFKQRLSNLKPGGLNFFVGERPKRSSSSPAQSSPVLRVREQHREPTKQSAARRPPDHFPPACCGRRSRFQPKTFARPDRTACCWASDTT